MGGAPAIAAPGAPPYRIAAMKLQGALRLVVLAALVGCGGDDDPPGADAAAEADSGSTADAGGPDAAMAPDPSASPLVSVGAQISDVAVAPDGSTYLVGGLSDPYDFGEGTVTPTGSWDILIVKYEPDGGLGWVKSYGGADINFANAVDLDADGNLYVTGSLRGSADFGGGLEGADATTGTDLFIASFSPTGAYRWAEVFASDGGQQDQGNGIAVGQNEVYVAGRAGRIMDLGGGTLGNLTDTAYLFTAAFDKDTGVHRWSKGHPYPTDFGSPFADLTDLVIDSQERLYVSGMIRGRIDLGNGNFDSSQLQVGETLIRTNTGWVVSYTGDSGAFRWLKLQDGDNREDTYALAVDADDNVYATGRYTTSADLGGGTADDSEASSIPTNFFAVSYSSVGAYRFHVAGRSPAGDTATSSSSGVTVASGEVLVPISFSGTLHIADATLDSVELSTSPGDASQDIGLVSLDAATGEIRWLRSYGGGGNDDGRRATTDGSDFYVTVEPEGVVEFDGATVEPQGSVTSTLLRIDE